MTVRKMTAILKKVDAQGCAPHVGASYLPKSYRREAVLGLLPSSSNLFRCIPCSGSIRLPTLADSPAFIGMEDKAKAEFGDLSHRVPMLCHSHARTGFAVASKALRGLNS